VRRPLAWLLLLGALIGCGDDPEVTINVPDGIGESGDTGDCPTGDQVQAALGTPRARFFDGAPTVLPQWELVCSYDLGDNGGLLIWRLDAGDGAQATFEAAVEADSRFVEADPDDASIGRERFSERSDDGYLVWSITDLTRIERTGFAFFAQGQVFRGPKVCGTTFNHLTDDRETADAMRVALPALLAEACA